MFIKVKQVIFVVVFFQGAFIYRPELCLYIHLSFIFHSINRHANFCIRSRRHIRDQTYFNFVFLLHSIYITHRAFYRGVCYSSYNCELFSSRKDRFFVLLRCRSTSITILSLDPSHGPSQPTYIPSHLNLGQLYSKHSSQSPPTPGLFLLFQKLCQKIQTMISKG